MQDHLDRLGIDGEVGQGPVSGLYTISPPPRPGPPRLDRDPHAGLRRAWCGGCRRVFIVEAVRSMLAHTEHENLEVVVVYDEPTPDAVMAELRELLGDRLVPVLSTEKQFNFSRKMNLGVMHSTGDRIVLLNDDVEVRSERWLEELVAPLDEPDVGMTGAKLYFSNDTIQHVGHRYADGHYHHIAFNRPRSYLGEFGGCAINREVSGVTAACAAITRETYERVGGFSRDASRQLQRRRPQLQGPPPPRPAHRDGRRRGALPLREPDASAASWRTGSDARSRSAGGAPRRDAFAPVPESTQQYR